ILALVFITLSRPQLYTLSLHDALPISYFGVNEKGNVVVHPYGPNGPTADLKELVDEVSRRGIGLPLLIRFSDILRRRVEELNEADRKSTRLNSSHVKTSYAVFCLKKKK